MELTKKQVRRLVKTMLKQLKDPAAGSTEKARLESALAATFGAGNYQALEALLERDFQQKAKQEEERALQEGDSALEQDETSGDYILKPEAGSCWITVDNVSVHVVRYKDEVGAKLYAKGCEMDDELDSCYALFAQAQEVIEAAAEAEDDAEEGGSAVETEATPTAETADWSTPPVPAECHCDDRVYEVDFMANRYLQQASDDELLALRECGWSFDNAADAVAEFMEDFNSGIRAMFAYLGQIQDIPSKKDCCGFGCSIDEEAGEAWIRQHRPHLALANEE